MTYHVKEAFEVEVNYVLIFIHYLLCSPQGITSKVCQKAHLLVVYAQSPDFHKLGLCYYLKILYL